LPVDSFIQDVIDQPRFLRQALEKYPFSAVEKLLERGQSSGFTKIVLTGHGASYNSLYPSFIKLSSQSIPTTLWQTSELLHYGINQIDGKTLLVVTSQSGQSAEVASLINKTLDKRPCALLAITNNPASELGIHQDVLIELNAGREEGVSTKTYFNSLSMAALLSVQLCGEDVNRAIMEMMSASKSMDEFLLDWETQVIDLDEKIGEIQNTIIVGRGPSMASAWTAALNSKEAGRLFFEGMNAGEFRHGPLELADENMTLIILEGDPVTVSLNSTLAQEVMNYGTRVLWIGSHPPKGIRPIEIPRVPELARPLAEILPLQLIVHVLAKRRNLEAGKFRRIGKIVMKE
jgi:glucosamine--fructose-6-phosphate aminotransferase (isomerizing)